MLFAIGQKADIEFCGFVQLSYGLRAEEQLAARVADEFTGGVGDFHVLRVFRIEIARFDHEAEIRTCDVNDDAVWRKRMGGAVGRRPACGGIVEMPLLCGDEGGGE